MAAEADTPTKEQRRPRTLAVVTNDRDDQWSVDERVAALWRSARLGPSVERLRRHVLRDGELTIDPSQFRTLDAIAAHGPCPARELALAMGIDQSAVTRTTTSLADAGLIQKRRSVGGQREVTVELTEAGANRHRYFVDRAYTLYEEIFAVFTRDERALLADFLERMLKSTDTVLSNPDPVVADEPSDYPSASTS